MIGAFDRYPHRSANQSANRWIVLVCLLSTSLAVLSVTFWVLARRDRHVVIHRTVDAAAIAVSVSDCPAARSCNPNGPVRAAVLDLVSTQFGPESIQYSSAVTDLASGRPYAELVQVRPGPGVQLEVTTRCVVGGATPWPSRPASIPATGPADLVAVSGGRPGCSVAVAVQVTKGRPVPWNQVLALVQSPAVQLPG